MKKENLKPVIYKTTIAESEARKCIEPIGFITRMLVATQLIREVTK